MILSAPSPRSFEVGQTYTILAPPSIGRFPGHLPTDFIAPISSISEESLLPSHPTSLPLVVGIHPSLASSPYRPPNSSLLCTANPNIPLSAPSRRRLNPSGPLVAIDIVAYIEEQFDESNWRRSTGRGGIALCMCPAQAHSNVG